MHSQASQLSSPSLFTQLTVSGPSSVPNSHRSEFAGGHRGDRRRYQLEQSYAPNHRGTTGYFPRVYRSGGRGGLPPRWSDARIRAEGSPLKIWNLDTPTSLAQLGGHTRPILRNLM